MELPETMKAVLLKGHGGFDQLEYREDVAVPVPQAGEVLVRVRAAGVNNTDINTRMGWYSRSVTAGTEADGAAAGIVEAKAEDAGWTGTPLGFPRIQGADAAGHIVAVGEGVPHSRVGERVLVEPVFRAPDASFNQAIYFGSECDGAFAEYARVPSRHAHAITCPLSDAELASFPCSWSAAENMVARAGVKSGERVLITGASGGVGSAAVQLAARRGAHVVALAAASKAQEVRALGAAEVLARDADLKSLLGGESIDAVIDGVGGAGFPVLLDILKRGGRYAVVGAIAGPVVPLDLRTLYLKDLSLLGCTVLGPDVFPHLVGYIERGEVKPVVAAVFPLREIVLAQQAFLEKRHTGKIVLTI
jgi:NADPH:quinone reductase-like Zn-dependent oxidoreductase